MQGYECINFVLILTLMQLYFSKHMQHRELACLRAACYSNTDMHACATDKLLKFMRMRATSRQKWTEHVALALWYAMNKKIVLFVYMKLHY